MDEREHERRLERTYHWIKWQEPEAIRILGDDPVSGFVCRYCVAMVGLKMPDDMGRIMTRKDCQRHIETEHL